MNKVYRQLSELSDNHLLDVLEQGEKIAMERGVTRRSVRYKQYRVDQISLKADEYFDQDWSDLFCADYDITKKYYVYFHIDPRIKRYAALGLSGVGMPFYVGKGTGDRAYCKRRSKPHLALINQILSEGYAINDIVKIRESDLCEKDAFVLESKYINFFGCISEIPKTLVPWVSGKKCGMLINTDTGIRPDWITKKINEIKFTPDKARKFKKAKREAQND